MENTLTQGQLKEFVDSLGWRFRVTGWQVFEPKGRFAGEIKDGKWVEAKGNSLLRNKIWEAFPETR